MKRILSLFVSLSCLLTCLTGGFSALADTEPNQAEPSTETSAGVQNSHTDSSAEGQEVPTYTAYRQAYAAMAAGTQTIKISASAYKEIRSGAQAQAVDFEGKSGVLRWDNEEGSVIYEFTVPQDGWYELNLSYYALPSRGIPLTVGVKIDGAYPFDGAEEFELPRLWKDEVEEFLSDSSGNEFAPTQVEVFQYQTMKAKDSSGFVTDPYQFALTAGTHTIELFSINEPFVLEYLELTPPPAVPTYAELAQTYAQNGYAHCGSDTLIIEGEDAAYKSASYLAPKSDSSDPSVSPTDPWVRKINYIGSTNWQTPGEIITWTVKPTKTGLYKLGFKFRQNQVLNGLSYRRLTINGELPFAEAAAIAFPFQTGWQYKELADAEGNPYLLYLQEGEEYTFSLEVTMGDISTPAGRLGAVMETVGTLYRQMVKITGETPDYNRDYELFDQIPGFNDSLTACRTELEDIAKQVETISGKQGSSNAATIRTLTAVLKNMVENQYIAHQYKKLFYDTYCSVSALVYEMSKMPLDLDYMALADPDTEVSGTTASFFAKIPFSFQRFLSSFITDYNSNSSTEGAEKDPITIWVNWGRDQARVLSDLVQSEFTPETGIPVNIRMTNASYIHGILSGNGPDCSLNMPRSEPVNLALRDAMYDLKQFDDYEEVIKRYESLPDALVPYTFNDGVYALPDTVSFYMMFVRTDVLAEYGLETPKTWDEFIAVTAELARNNLQVSLPYNQILQMTQVNSGVGALSIFPTLLMQNGGSIYNEDLTKTELLTPTAIQSFEFWTSLITEYKQPVTADFYNRFRVGVMPLGVQNYSMYIQLTMAAPEITGKWQMLPIPGVEQPDGTINNLEAGGGTGCGIMNVSKNKAGGWEFLKWWTDADTQLSYSNNCESILGVSGRVATANLDALTRMGWDSDSLDALLSQWDQLTEVEEIPGGYYTARVIEQAYWNVVNNKKNVKDMLVEWAAVADEEIARKRHQYHLD